MAALAETRSSTIKLGLWLAISVRTFGYISGWPRWW